MDKFIIRRSSSSNLSTCANENQPTSTTSISAKSQETSNTDGAAEQVNSIVADPFVIPLQRYDRDEYIR